MPRVSRGPVGRREKSSTPGSGQRPAAVGSAHFGRKHRGHFVRGIREPWPRPRGAGFPGGRTRTPRGHGAGSGRCVLARPLHTERDPAQPAPACGWRPPALPPALTPCGPLLQSLEKYLLSFSSKSMNVYSLSEKGAGPASEPATSRAASVTTRADPGQGCGPTGRLRHPGLAPDVGVGCRLQQMASNVETDGH